jgi:hypothetical protein
MIRTRQIQRHDHAFPAATIGALTSKILQPVMERLMPSTKDHQRVGEASNGARDSAGNVRIVSADDDGFDAAASNPITERSPRASTIRACKN